MPTFSALVKSDHAIWKDTWVSKPQEYPYEVAPWLQSSTFHADPLEPLRQRDAQALEEMFDDVQMEEIFIDICDRLRQLYPEPCWDDDSFDFLQEYM